MTRVKRIVTTTCAASFLLGWTGISNMQLLIPFRSAGASVLLAQQNNAKASYNQGYQLGRKDAKHGQNSDNRHQRNESSQWNSEFRRGYEDGYAGRSRNDGTYDLSRNMECMTGHATKTSTADQAITNPTAVPAR